MLARIATLTVACLLYTATAAMAEGAHVKPVTDYVTQNIKPWLTDPAVVNAIKAENEVTKKLKNYDINKLDNGWIDRTNKELIDAKMNNALSTFLRAKKEAAKGVIFEIFVFNDKGLNVGQTDLTQDYNQGDEAKYWKTFQVGPDALFVDDVEEDGGKNVSQARMTIKDPATGKPIGAVTVGIDVDQLAKHK